MEAYTPDNWVILKIVNGDDKPIYKVLAGFDDDSTKVGIWRLNSGIVECEESANNLYFYGMSGSCYRCTKGKYGLRSATAGFYGIFVEGREDKISIMPEDTDWKNVEWNLSGGTKTVDLQAI